MKINNSLYFFPNHGQTWNRTLARIYNFSNSNFPVTVPLLVFLKRRATNFLEEGLRGQPAWGDEHPYYKIETNENQRNRTYKNA